MPYVATSKHPRTQVRHSSHLDAKKPRSWNVCQVNPEERSSIWFHLWPQIGNATKQKEFQGRTVRTRKSISAISVPAIMFTQRIKNSRLEEVQTFSGLY